MCRPNYHAIFIHILHKIREKQFYLNMLEDAPSNCSGCHQYVKHSYYRFPKICFSSAMVINSSTMNNDEQIVIHVVVHKSDLNHMGDQCTI